MILYPAIDIRGGQAVRLLQGDYARETTYDADPVDAAARWAGASPEALRREVTRPHLKDPYTHELEYFHRMVTSGGRPKTDPEDFVADLDLFAELIRVIAKDT